MCSLHQSASTISTAIYIATNSDPKVEDSTVFCALEYQIIGAWLRNISMPV
jgi:hypothetical protein